MSSTKKSHHNHNNLKILIDRYKYVIGEQDVDDYSFEILLEDIINYYENIIVCMPGNVYWLDKNGMTLGCNKNVLEMFGLKTIKEFKGLSFEDMGKLARWSKTAEQSFKQDTLEVVKAGKSKLNIEEPPIPHSNGSVIYFLTSRVPLFDQSGNVVGVVGISVDITQRKEIEEQLKISKEQAEAANKAKTEFLANISHDIRTPVSGVIGISEILEQQGASKQDRNYGHLIHSSTEQLLQLLNDILDVISVESLQEDNIEVEAFDLRKSIRHLEELLRPGLYLKDINFKISIDENLNHKIVSDRVKIERILLNLLSNAIKFTSHGYVEINIKSLATANELAHLEFTISDSGIGIPKNQIDKVFDRFFRATPSYEGVYEGHGIGLYLVKKFVTLLKGEINIQSQLGKGTIVSIILPVKIISTEEEISASNEINIIHTISNLKFQKFQKENLFPAKSVLPTSERPRVLLVEDDHIARFTAQNFFHTAGCEIEIAVNVESAIKMAKLHYLISL